MRRCISWMCKNEEGALIAACFYYHLTVLIVTSLLKASLSFILPPSVLMQIR